MTEHDLRASLTTVEGDAPSPAFLASLSARIEHEVAVRPETDLPAYLPDPVGAPSSPARPTAVLPTGGRGRWAIAAIAAAVVLIAGFVVVDRGDDGSRLATGGGTPAPFTASVLPSAVIHASDGDVVVGGPPSAGLGLVLAPWYTDERATLDDLGFGDGLAVPFDLDLAGADGDCPELIRDPVPDPDPAYLPCGGLSAALLFPDAADAARALDVLVAHIESHAGAIYQVGFPLERTLDLEAELGEEADAFVLETFLTSQDVAQVVVATWRTDNLVQLVWDIQLRDTVGGVGAVMAVAESIDNRTAGERPVRGDGG